MSRVLFAFISLCLVASFKWPWRADNSVNHGVLTMASNSNTNEKESTQESLVKAIELHQKGMLIEALEAYSEFITMVQKGSKEIAPSTLSSIHSNIGAIHMSYGDYEQARKSFEDAVEIDPEDSMAHYNLAITLTSKLNDHRQALKHARLASKIDTDNPSILHLIANILQSLGASDEASRFFFMAEQASKKEDSSPHTLGNIRSDMAWGHLSSVGLATAKHGDVYRTETEDGREITMTCISSDTGAPLAFLIKKLVSSDECSQIIEKANPLMERSYVMGDNSDGADVEEGAYRSSENAWLAPYSMPLLKSIQRRLADLTGFSLQSLVEAAEELQVIRYAPGGQFKAHHDSTGFKPRLFTALMYLNGLDKDQEGGTWFPYVTEMPREDTTTATVPLDSSTLQSVQESIQIALGVQKSEISSVGLTVQPSAGDCVLFFNYLPDGALDLTAVHAGLPLTEGQKWAANYWYGPLTK